MMNCEDGERGVEGSIREGKRLGAGLNRGRCTGRTLPNHRPRGLDRDDTAVFWFVGAGTGPDIHDRRRVC
jgi:hypothetical protein